MLGKRRRSRPYSQTSVNMSGRKYGKFTQASEERMSTTSLLKCGSIGPLTAAANGSITFSKASNSAQNTRKLPKILKLRGPRGSVKVTLSSNTKYWWTVSNMAAPMNDGKRCFFQSRWRNHAKEIILQQRAR